MLCTCQFPMLPPWDVGKEGMRERERESKREGRCQCRGGLSGSSLVGIAAKLLTGCRSADKVRASAFLTHCLFIVNMLGNLDNELWYTNDFNFLIGIMIADFVPLQILFISWIWFDWGVPVYSCLFCRVFFVVDHKQMTLDVNKPEQGDGYLL